MEFLIQVGIKNKYDFFNKASNNIELGLDEIIISELFINYEDVSVSFSNIL